MCTSLRWVFLNTNKKAARQGHGPKLKSHFPASDTAISPLTLTLAPQLWGNSHYGLGKEIVPGWEVNYAAWHKNVEKANSTCFSLGKRFFFFVQISPCYLVKQLPTCPIYSLLWIWFKFCILHTLGFLKYGKAEGIWGPMLRFSNAERCRDLLIDLFIQRFNH